MKKTLFVIDVIFAVAAIFTKTAKDSDHEESSMTTGCSHPTMPIGF